MAELAVEPGELEELLDTAAIDLGALRRRRLEDEELRLLASAVGDHPLPPEQLSRLECVRDQLRCSAGGSAA